MKTNSTLHLKQLYSTNIKIGFIAALAITILAINWEFKRPASNFSWKDNTQTEFEVEIIRTSQPASKNPPPLTSKVPLSAEVVEAVPVASGIIHPTENIIEEPSFQFSPPQQSSNVTFFQPERPEEPESKAPFIIVEDMPRFPGCEKENISKKDKQACADRILLDFMRRSLAYPAFARDNRIEGIVVVRFIVEQDGNISNAEIVRDIGGGCGREALRVVNSMPKWIPGRQQGRTVRVQFNLPVKFKLE